MKRWQRWTLSLAVFLLVWYSLWAKLLPITLPQPIEDILPLLPMYLLVSFGFYSLAVIGYNLLTFRDCPEDAKQLQEEIKQARKELSQRGLKFE